MQPVETREKVLVGLLSGGVDSAVAFARERAEGRYGESIAVFMSWGQTALSKETMSFERVCDFLTVDRAERRVYKLGFEWCEPAGQGAQRLFPVGRNLVFLSAACAAAATLFPGHRVTVTVGFTANDGLADTSEEFLERVREIVRLTTIDAEHPTEIHVRAPFRKERKSEVIRWAVLNGFGGLLELTWSCYGAGPVPCGTCLGCKIRREAFSQAEVRDLTVS